MAQGLLRVATAGRAPTSAVAGQGRRRRLSVGQVRSFPSEATMRKGQLQPFLDGQVWLAPTVSSDRKNPHRRADGGVAASSVVHSCKANGQCQRVFDPMP